MNEMVGNAERVAENGRTGELHRIVMTWTGEKRRTSTAVNDTNGRLTNEQSERLKIWKDSTQQDSTQQRTTCQAYTAAGNGNKVKVQRI